MEYKRCGSIGNLRVSGLALLHFGKSRAFVIYLIGDYIDSTVPRNSNDRIERTEVDTHDRHTDWE